MSHNQNYSHCQVPCIMHRHIFWFCFSSICGGENITYPSAPSPSVSLISHSRANCCTMRDIKNNTFNTSLMTCGRREWHERNSHRRNTWHTTSVTAWSQPDPRHVSQRECYSIDPRHVAHREHDRLLQPSLVTALVTVVHHQVNVLSLPFSGNAAICYLTHYAQCYSVFLTVLLTLLLSVVHCC